MTDHHETVKHVFDWAALGTAIATLAGWLPPLAAGMSILWLAIQMFDRWRYGPSALRRK